MTHQGMNLNGILIWFLDCMPFMLPICCVLSSFMYFSYIIVSNSGSQKVHMGHLLWKIVYVVIRVLSACVMLIS
jgi:hypothetical protein